MEYLWDNFRKINSGAKISLLSDEILMRLFLRKDKFLTKYFFYVIRNMCGIILEEG